MQRDIPAQLPCVANEVHLQLLIYLCLPCAPVLLRVCVSVLACCCQMLDDPGTSARSSTVPQPASAPSATATAQTTTAHSTTAQTTTAQSTAAQSTTAQSTSAQSSSSGNTSSSTPRTGLLQLVPLVLSGGPARTFLHLIIAVHVARVTATILDDFIRRFNPSLPYNWLGACQEEYAN